MTINVVEWDVYLKIAENVDKLSKNKIDSCIWLKVMAKRKLKQTIWQFAMYFVLI